ncbi:unnamed protein product [Pseudo-nitzschia multistriata]|uniref:Uncharacterized protein n=1 Tax=Pseudo-nitzschia multistriata TaxID=183589 RepID=A0A448ZGP3_9STRA|nr:unnamed protein product [Pseudo-nitzschia multistriata]
MTAADTRNATSTAPIKVTDFDIVAKEVPGPKYVLAEDYNNGKHIGNNRFDVLVDMYVDDFHMNQSKNHRAECDRIIGIIRNVNSRGRFLGKALTTPGEGDGDSDSDRFIELSDKDARLLIEETITTRIEAKQKEIFEPLPLLDAIGFGRESFYNEGKHYDNNHNNIDGTNTGKTGPPVLRRSRSASEMGSDADDAFWEVLRDLEPEPVDYESNRQADEFEPLPLHANDSSCIDPDLVLRTTRGYRTNHNNNTGDTKKRGRRYSLLRRSNSFESAFDRKKTIKNLYGVVPKLRQRPGPLIPSFDDPQASSPAFVADAIHSTMDMIAGMGRGATSGAGVRTHRGMDVVFEQKDPSAPGGGYALSPKADIVGNNRLRVLIDLEKDRVGRLPTVEQHTAASGMVTTVTNDWKGRLLVDRGRFASYASLGREEATAAVLCLLVGPSGGTPAHGATRPAAASGATSSLLSSAPPLPAFLLKASNEILNGGRQKHTMTTKERQARAVENLKARQLAKEKDKEKD